MSKKIGLFVFIVFMMGLSIYSSKMINRKQPPCEAILHACKQAGYIDDQVGRKSVFTDCLKPLMTGQAVANVVVSKVDVDACASQTQPH
jgi:hypothetical protein